MTYDHSALITQLDALKGADPASVFDELIRTGLQALIDAEATEVVGAGRYERTTERFRERTLTHTSFPYVFLDATYCKVRIGAHVVSHALVAT